MWRITAALGLLVVPNAWAQQAEAGRIDRIAESVRPGKWQGVDSTSKVRLLRLPSPEWKSAGRKGSVLLNDRMQVERLVDVQVGVERPAQQGKLIFLTELLDKDLRPVVEAPNGRELESASYEMRPDSADPSLLAVHVEQGSLIIDWVHGRLLVVTPVTRFVIRGTKVALTVYPGGAAGFVLLQSGVVTFLDSPGVQIKEGEIAEFQPGRAPRVSRPGLEDGLRFRNAVQYNAKGVWSQLTPFWQKAAFLLPVTAAAGAAAAVVVSQSGDDDGTRAGSVVIGFP
jgi:hypothetical protein